MSELAGSICNRDDADDWDMEAKRDASPYADDTRPSFSLTPKRPTPTRRPVSPRPSFSLTPKRPTPTRRSVSPRPSFPHAETPYADPPIRFPSYWSAGNAFLTGTWWRFAGYHFHWPST